MTNTASAATCQYVYALGIRCGSESVIIYSGVGYCRAHEDAGFLGPDQFFDSQQYKESAREQRAKVNAQEEQERIGMDVKLRRNRAILEQRRVVSEAALRVYALGNREHWDKEERELRKQTAMLAALLAEGEPI